MSVSFDWNLKEEPGSPRYPREIAGRSDRRRRWLLRFVVTLCLLVVVGLVLRAWLKNRVDALEKMDAELRSVVELELKTIADGDAELFRSQQDPEDSQWKARQIARYITRPTSLGPAPGLVPADRSPEIERVHVLGQSGRVELTQWYAISSEEPKEPLSFHTTWFYHRDDDGIWYHVAPPDAYWGVPYSWYGSRLVIRATEVESKLLDPIAYDLSILVARGCQLLACPEGIRYTLSFDGELVPLIQDDWWTLPALYLTGLPEDEEARAAWVRALKMWLVEALAQARAGDRTLADRMIFRQLVARLQVELGLPPGPEIESIEPDIELLAEALIANRQHAIQDLWLVRYEPSDPEEMRLFDTEIALLLQWVEGKVGNRRLFGLLPVLGDYAQLDAALLMTYRLAPRDLETQWMVYLFKRAGLPAPSDVVSQAVAPIESPPTTQGLSVSPGD